MDQHNFTTKPQKCQHLCATERNLIEVRFNEDGKTIYDIAKELGRAYNTVKTEIHRGAVKSDEKTGKVIKYSAEAGYNKYCENRRQCRKKYKLLRAGKFLKQVIRLFKEKHWSLDVCVHWLLLQEHYDKKDAVCTKTLYTYVDNHWLDDIRNIDLPEKLGRNTKRHQVRKNLKKLGKSIEERPPEIDNRQEFGHWEIDSVLGQKGAEKSVVIALTERKTRASIWMKVKNHSAEAMDEALEKLFQRIGDQYRKIFKTITADNGSEFANLSHLEERGIGIYFTHPYSSCEKGTVERHNRLLRRFIPKGRDIGDYSADELLSFEKVTNGLPRKILGYATPREMFLKELHQICSEENV